MPSTIRRFPDALSKIHILYGGKTSPEALSSHGRAFEEAGHLYDAIDFFEEAEDKEGAGRVLQVALAEGNAFLVKRASRVMGSPPGREALLSAARAADEKGFRASAASLYEEAGETEQAARIRAEAGIQLPSRESLGAVKAEEDGNGSDPSSEADS